MTTLSQANFVSLHSDIVVIGHNSEYADFENPRGERYGHCVTIVAEAPDGSRWVWRNEFTRLHEDDARAAAQPHLLRIRRAMQVLGGAGLDERLWDETQPMYGSEAYDRGGWEAEAAYAERNA